MTATKEDIRRWFKKGAEEGEAYMIIVCDTFDYDDYPVYTSKESYNERHSHYIQASMQTIMEVYDLNQDMEEQLAEHRCFRGPKM